MFRLRTILHPTDFSKHSDAAFQFACSLAREYFAEILLVHVVEPAFEIGVEGQTMPIPSDEPEQARKRLEAVFPLDPHVKVRREVVLGKPIDAIVRVAAESKADMIVMGTHGRGGFSRLLMGSVAEGVLRKVPCPVLFVKEPSTEANAKHQVRKSA
jgi:nucleotide-binding universal stress UspA family protein